MLRREVKSDTHVIFHSDIMESSVNVRKYGLRWHLATFGKDVNTLDEAEAYLQDIEDHWNDPSDDDEWEPVSHAEMTHEFLAYEASLDSYPY